MTIRGCEEFVEAAPELALGVLTGTERAQALEHLEVCLRCRSRLDRLTEVSDVLMDLVTPVEPPLGFEVRVAARLQQPSSARNRWRLVGRAAVVATAVLGAGLAGWVGATATRTTAPAAVQSAQLTSGAHSAGRIFLHSRAPSWVYMSIDVGGGSESVTCELETGSGRVVRLGSFQLVDGYGYWAAPVPSGSGQIRSARVVTDGGTVLATASFYGS